MLTREEPAAPTADPSADRQYAGDMSAMPGRHVVTADEFVRMAEAGVFHPEERLELWEGEILAMSPIGSRHVGCVNRLTTLFAPLMVSGQVVVQVQGPIRLTGVSVPQPDLVLLHPRDDYYASGYAVPPDIALTVEVADTSLRFDLQTKLPAYASAGIVEAWVVDVNGGAVYVATKPEPDGYRDVAERGLDDTVAPSAFPDVTIVVRELLGVPEARRAT